MKVIRILQKCESARKGAFDTGAAWLICSTLFGAIQRSKTSYNGEAQVFTVRHLFGKLWITGNTVGSTMNADSNIINDEESAYILGLWCADGYYWSSSIGLSNSDIQLLQRFNNFLRRYFPENRLKWRAYCAKEDFHKIENMKAYVSRKAKMISYHLYVNSRPLLRRFREAEGNIQTMSEKQVIAYFAGRFDGDGSISKDLRSDLRIAYSNQAEAEVDYKTLNKLKRYKLKVYRYKSAGTYVLYFSRFSAGKFLNDIYPYSVVVQSLLPRRDSIAQ